MPRRSSRYPTTTTRSLAPSSVRWRRSRPVIATWRVAMPDPPRGSAPAARLLQALHVVDAVAVLDPVGVMAEPGEPRVPGREGTQVAQIGAVLRAGGLAGHEHRDAGGIRHHAGGKHVVGQRLERHVLDVVA